MTDKNTLETVIDLKIDVMSLLVIVSGLDLALKHPEASQLKGWAPAARTILANFYVYVKQYVPDYPYPESLEV